MQEFNGGELMLPTYNHYFRLDADGWIVKTFSDAFETPLQTDILYDTSADRHFNMALYNENRRLYKRWVNGGIVIQEKPRTLEEKMIPIRAERDRLLASTDYIILRQQEQEKLVKANKLGKTKMTDSQYVAILEYRQQLRDLENTMDVDNPVFPQMPNIGG